MDKHDYKEKAKQINDDLMFHMLNNIILCKIYIDSNL